MAKNEKEQATKKDLSESSQSLVICSHGSFAARPFAYTIGSTCYQCYPQSTQEFVSSKYKSYVVLLLQKDCNKERYTVRILLS
jgi:hypothetical protein